MREDERRAWRRELARRAAKARGDAPLRAPADHDRRRQRGARLPDHGLAGSQPRRRRAPLGRDARAGDEGGRAARLSAGAARLRAGRSAAAASIGFICDEISTDPWTAIGLDGVREKAWERGLTVMVMATRGDADMESAALAQLTAQPLVGLVYATINTRLIDAPAALSKTPTVLLNCHVANGALPSVVPGEVAGGHAATDVLIRAGHRRIGYINGEASMEASRHRLRGYRQALATADLPFDPDLMREGNWQPISGYEAARELMSAQAPADRDLLRQRPDGGRLLRCAA